MRKSLKIGILAVCLAMIVWLVGAATQQYHESPMLHQLVIEGKLPPVEERLPVDPMVVGPPQLKQIGVYGGVYKFGVVHEIGTYLWPEANLGEAQDIRPFIATSLVWPTYNPADYSGERIQPALAKSWEWSTDRKTLTMHLRRGVRWSDGTPFTASDVFFTYNNVYTDKNIAPDAADHFSEFVDGKYQKIQLKKLDDFTIQFLLPIPDTTFLWKIAWAGNFSILPRHTLVDKHPAYNSNATVGDFMRALNARAKLPSLGPWMVEAYYPGQQLNLTRNPYYWKVDEKGNQLPYIDKVVIRIYKSQETLIMNFMAGAIDSYGEFPVVNKYSTIKQNESRGNYTVYLTPYIDGPSMLFNLGEPADKKLEAIFADVRFRKALALALDRNVLGNLYAPGRFLPVAARSFSPVCMYHDPKAVPVPEYNPEEANKLLDEVGLVDQNHDGIRQWPDGKDFQFEIMVAPRGVADLVQAIRQYWEKVGIKTTISTPEEGAFISRLFAGDFDMWASRGSGFPNDPLNQMVWWVAPPPGSENEQSTALFNLSNWKFKWNQDAYQLFQEAIHAGDFEAQRQLMSQAEYLISHAYAGVGLFWVRWSYGISNRLGNHLPDLAVAGIQFPGFWAEGYYVKH